MQDLVPDNLLLSTQQDVDTHPGVPLEADKVYIVDFGVSQQYALESGVQPAITLPPSHIVPPNGLKHFDPYSWDVYCVGHSFQWIAKVSFYVYNS